MWASGVGARAQFLHGTWDLPRPGIETVSPALAGGISSTRSPGIPLIHLFDWGSHFLFLWYILEGLGQCVLGSPSVLIAISTICHLTEGFVTDQIMRKKKTENWKRGDWQLSGYRLRSTDPGVRSQRRDFLGGSVTKTPCSQSRGPWSNPWSGNQIPSATKSSRAPAKDPPGHS